MIPFPCIKRALIVGGSHGIGLSIAHEIAALETTEKVYVVDKSPIDVAFQHPKIEFYSFDLTQEDYSFFDQFQDINALMITAGFGHLDLFENISEEQISTYFQVNTIAGIRIIKHFYPQLQAHEPFYCGMMVSIAGFMSSPFFSVYAATKAALKVFIESVNVELLKGGSENRILNVSPGSIQGTSFSNGPTQLELTRPLAQEILQHLLQQDDLFIPQYEEIFKQVLARYQADFRAEGLHSYEYKVQSGRASAPRKS